MKIITNKETFLKSIITADRVISSKNLNTVLSNCLFNVKENQIEIISTDNEITITTRLDATSEGKVSFTANSKTLTGILKKFPNDEIVLNINDKMVLDIDTQSKEIKGHYSLVGTTAEDYPDIPTFSDKNFIEIEQNILKEILKKVMYAASNDNIKPVFNGIFINLENGNEITAVATDSRRLSMITRKLENENSFSEERNFIIPLKTVNEILRLLESTGRCSFAFNNSLCFFKIGNTEIISRVIDGQFPNYKHVIPSDYIMNVVVEKTKLVDAVRRIMVLTKEPANKIVCKFNSDSLILEANTPDKGTGEEELPIENNSKDSINIGINAQFLLDCLEEIDSFSIKCDIVGQMSPVKFVPEQDDSYVSVVMPIQIKSDNID